MRSQSDLTHHSGDKSGLGGACVGAMWALCGLCVDSVWALCGLRLGSVWALCGLSGLERGRSVAWDVGAVQAV